MFYMNSIDQKFHFRKQLYKFAFILILIFSSTPVLASEVSKNTEWQDEIGAKWAHEKGYTGEDIKVAVIDTSTDLTHTAFQNRLKIVEPSSYEIDSTRIKGAQDPHHATHVCGILGGNIEEFKGVAPDCAMTLYNGYISKSILEEIAASSAKVVNLSLKAENYFHYYESLLEIAKNKILVVAAGNNAQDIDFNKSLKGLRKLAVSPSNNVIIVGHCYAQTHPDYPRALHPNSSRPGDIYATTIPPMFESSKQEQAETGSIADFYIVAPGVDIKSTLPQGKYGLKSGTSMSTPMVAGAACLLWQKYPHWSAHQVTTTILESASPIQQFPSTFSYAYKARKDHEEKTGKLMPYNDQFSEYYGRGFLDIKAMFELAEKKEKRSDSPGLNIFHN